MVHMESKHGVTEMKKFANKMGYTDVNPFEVVKVISDKTVEIRAMKAELDPSWKPEFVPGGFSVHCTNQWDQRWNIESDEGQIPFRIRLSKKKGWQDKYGNRYSLDEKPVKFYDYNF